MVPLLDLWLPILVSTVLVFVVSSGLSVVLQLRRPAFQKLPNEDEVLAVLRANRTPPGRYLFPYAASMKEMGSPEMIGKRKQGPVGSLIVLSSEQFSLGVALAKRFLLPLVISAFTGYLLGMALPPGSELAGRMASTIALFGYALSHAKDHGTDSIWSGLSGEIPVSITLEGVAAALVTGATFAKMWPAGGT